MTPDPSPPARNPAAFRRSLQDRIRNEARRRGTDTAQLRRAFFLQRFLARVFSVPGDRWLLKGGAALLVRLPDARYSRDVDLLHTAAAVEDALSELQMIVEDDSDLDPFRFVMAPPRVMTTGIAGAQVQVSVYYGAMLLEEFPVDLSTEVVPIGDVEYRSPTPPMMPIEGLAPMPDFALYPLAQQIADKVCAMYEIHNGQPSTRFHDLVDLVLIVTNWPIDAPAVRAALRAEAARRSLTLPTTIGLPASMWAAGYARLAKTVTALPTAAHTVDGALRIVSAHLNPLLTDETS